MIDTLNLVRAIQPLDEDTRMVRDMFISVRSGHNGWKLWTSFEHAFAEQAGARIAGANRLGRVYILTTYSGMTGSILVFGGRLR